jgi:biopolymer transport protein ExbD
VFDEWKRKTSEEPASLDLIPVMNLFMVLIPFLLLGAAFVHMSVIPTSTPIKKSGASNEKPPEDPTSVMAQLVLKPEEMELTFSGAGVPQETLDSMAASWSITDGEFPLDELQQKLRVAKGDYPDSNTVTVVPHKEFAYQDLVEILDATRERQVGETEEGDPKFEPLFPVTVFSKFPPPASSEDGDGDGEAADQGGE